MTDTCLKLILNDILATVEGECLCGTLPDLDVDTFEYSVDNSDCDTENHTILSGFKHFRKDCFSSSDGLIACLDVCISPKSKLPICCLYVEDYFGSFEDSFVHPELTSHLTSVQKYPNGDSESHHYINKIVSLGQAKEAYINLLKDIQAFITSLK